MVTKATRKCSICRQEKPITSFGMNGRFVYSICRACKGLREAARKYGLTIEQVKIVRGVKNCMCCGWKFPNSTMQHIHHTKHGYQGVVCQYCNHILHQESFEDLRRIEACLVFMNQPRKNLFNKDNPQGRSLVIPSTTTRPARFDEQVCNRCKRILPLAAFRVDRKWRRKTCKHCEVCLEGARKYNLTYTEVYTLYLCQVCDCCQSPFTLHNIATIHHVGDRALGILCHRCNRLLGQETDEQRKRLENCAAWIKR